MKNRICLLKEQLCNSHDYETDKNSAHSFKSAVGQGADTLTNSWLNSKSDHTVKIHVFQNEHP